MEDKEPLNQNKWQQTFEYMNEDQKQYHAFSANNWFEDIDNWWQTQPDTVEESVDDLYQKILFSSRFFMNFFEPFVTSEKKMAKPAAEFINYLEIFIQSIENGSTIQQEANEHIKGFWALPFEIWQQQMSVLSGFPKSFFQFADQQRVDDDYPEFYHAFQNFIKTLHNYRSAYLTMSIDAAMELIQQLRNQNSNHCTGRQICTLWIELFEKHYAKFVSDDAYSKLYAEIINSWMLLIQQTKQLITPWLTAMNMPVTSDLDSIKAYQQVLLKENQLLREQLSTYIDKP